MIMLVGNLIVPARDKSSLGNSILMSVGQSGERGGGGVACIHARKPFRKSWSTYKVINSPFPSGTEPVTQDLIFARLSLQT